ncbi:hypothetical protein HY968_01520 [Candidatus Kaiserbacteria bacterium]|nr:hypothetical protein [Candidatus Kaiserbacteria bacterium]
MYSDRIKALLTPPERCLLADLKSSKAIQDYLDALPVNFELKGETYMSPRRTIAAKKAHCFEGAILAATALAYHGHKPLLMDFQTAWDDEDHVIALYKKKGYWGALSKTNHAVLRYRDPVYRSVRELAMSYFHEYFLWDGRKSLRAYSAPYDLSRHWPSTWVTAEEDLDWLAEKLDKSRHFPIASPKNIRPLRPASEIEISALKLVEWKRPRKSRDNSSG